MTWQVRLVKSLQTRETFRWPTDQQPEPERPATVVAASARPSCTTRSVLKLSTIPDTPSRHPSQPEFAFEEYSSHDHPDSPRNRSSSRRSVDFSFDDVSTHDTPPAATASAGGTCGRKGSVSSSAAAGAGAGAGRASSARERQREATDIYRSRVVMVSHATRRDGKNTRRCPYEQHSRTHSRAKGNSRGVRRCTSVAFANCSLSCAALPYAHPCTGQ
jgi:hypothetical protein